MEYERYINQVKVWPKAGRHILAQYDDKSIIVYQAYKSSIADYAIKHQKFGGDFLFSRMSWIKPNFMWMMYRAGWGTKEGQEKVLAIRISRTFFDGILERAAFSDFQEERYVNIEKWKEDLKKTDVRLQWDPDYGPSGNRLERKAIQLGLKGRTLYGYANSEVMEIIDMSDFVAKERENKKNKGELRSPKERIYIPGTDEAIRNIGLTVE